MEIDYNDIGIYFEYNNLVIQIPVNPEKLELVANGNNSTENIINLGDINLIKIPKLREISWESWFPYESWFPAIRTKGQFQSIKFYLNFIEQIRKDKKPFRLIITGMDINMLATIEDFTYTKQNGDYEDTYYNIKLKEYREYAVKKISIETTDEVEKSVTDVGTEPQNTEFTPTATEITIGCSVILNGQVFRDSYGSGGGNTYTQYTGIVNLINEKGSHPYHITSGNNENLGWVTKDSVVLA